MIKSITDAVGAPEAIGPYSQAIVYKDLAFLSGQIPLDPKTGELVAGGVSEQTEQVLKNATAVLHHLGLSLNQVLKTTIFLTDLADFTKVNEIYARYFGSHRPARSTVQVVALPRGARVEIEMVAAIN